MNASQDKLNLTYWAVGSVVLILAGTVYWLGCEVPLSSQEPVMNPHDLPASHGETPDLYASPKPLGNSNRLDQSYSVPQAFPGMVQTRHFSGVDGNPLYGYYVREGLSITWSGSKNSSGMEPVDVLKAVQERLQYLERTPQGGVENEKALFQLLKVIDILEGSNEVSAPIQESGFIAPPGSAPPQE